jgi:lipopolysaccharide biosynthesis regulator YciM
MLAVAPDTESGAIVTAENREILKRSNMSLANIFFKFQHEDQTVMRHLLVNREQEQVVNLVIEKLQQFVQNSPQCDSSLTYIPFYDTVLPMERRNLLA